ncbi:MAG: DUF2868 domain-containing protein [Thermoanaerobaculia bacterium]|nr:DUF2868 domain-containing protein [Thermoanaerobaculia bacterium]
MGTTRLREEDTQAILLVRAFEEADREGLLALPPAATPAEGSPGARLAARARPLLAALDARFPFLRALRRTAGLSPRLGAGVALAALAAGLATSALGPAARVNLLSLPLLGLVAWNLAVYLAAALGWLLRGQLRPGGCLARLLPAAALLAQVRRLSGEIGRVLPGGSARVVGRALSAFLEAWRPLAAPLVVARGRRLFHLAAAALALGMIGGIYLRGLAFEYRATWESTFLSPRAAEAVIGALVAPGRLLVDVETEPIAALRAPADGDAAPWIHLLAATVALLVVAPRLLLALVESLRAARLALGLALDLDAPYFRRLLAAGPLRVLVQPYSFDPPPAARDTLARALRALHGPETGCAWIAPLPYGEAALPPLGEEAAAGILLFPLAQTPEPEVHGALARAASPAWLLAADASSLRARLGAGAPGRLEERRRLWEEAMAAAGRRLAVVDLELAEPEEAARQLAAAEAVSK